MLLLNRTRMKYDHWKCNSRWCLTFSHKRSHYISISSFDYKSEQIVMKLYLLATKIFNEKNWRLLCISKDLFKRQCRQFCVFFPFYFAVLKGTWFIFSFFVLCYCKKFQKSKEMWFKSVSVVHKTACMELHERLFPINSILSCVPFFSVAVGRSVFIEKKESYSRMLDVI